MRFIGHSVCQRCKGTGFVGYIKYTRHPDQLEHSFILAVVNEFLNKPMQVPTNEAREIIRGTRDRKISIFKPFLLKSLISITCPDCNGKKIGYKLYQV